VIVMAANLLAAAADGFIGSAGSRVLIAVLFGAAMAALTVTLFVVFGKRQARLERRLAGYELPEFATKPSANAGSAPDSSVVQQAVDFTERVAERAGMLRKVELLLQQADLPLRPAELLFYAPTFAIMTFLISALLFDGAVAIVLAAVVLAVPVVYVMRKRDERLKQFERQLPDTLVLLAGAMRAGFSFMQGLETVADESSGVMRRELQRVFTEARLGRAIEEALDETAERMQSRDLAWAVMAIRIQREVGGNLATLLDTVADTMTKRERLRREIKTLTAEGRFSAILLSLFPPVFGGLLFLWRHDYISKLFSESAGIIALCIAMGTSVIGWFWMRKIVKIEV
jgi:tight adherence protein B